MRNHEGIYGLGLRDAAERIREGRLTCVGLMRGCLARYAALEPRIEAWQWIDPARAMGLAERADARRRAGEALGLLHGIPVGVKDIVDVAGMPTTMGSPIHERNVAQASAQVVERIERAGGIVIGKTVTTEFAYYTPGKTRNPYHPAHTPGGSSMGSAAAVAAGMVPAALGTQTNGSVVRPAAFCGVAGYKPSRGAIATRGMLEFSRTLDQPGVLARSVADCALLAACVADAAGAIAASIAPLAAPPRLVAVRSPVWHLAQAAQREVYARNLERLRAEGAEIAEIELPPEFERAHAAHRKIMACEAARSLGEVQRAHRSLISPRLNAFLDEGAAIPEPQYRDALALQRELEAGFARFLAGADAIVTPPATGEAPATLVETGDPAFCTIWTLVGAPAITIPVGHGPQGLPLGLQIVGRARGDDRLLAVAEWCQRRFPFGGLPG